MHAVIVGGSLAGSCAALALAREGWRVTILEQSTAEPQGLGIGIDRDLLASVTGLDASAIPVIQTGFPATGWKFVLDLLLEGLRRDPAITLHRGSRAITLTSAHHTSGASVRTSDGTVQADLVVGADGYASTIRRFVEPDRPHATYSGFVLWRGVVAEQDTTGGFHNRDLAFRIHDSPSALLATYGIPGLGAAQSFERRGVYTWFDPTRTQLLRDLGSLHGDTVIRSLRGQDLDDATLTGLRRDADTWPKPWDRLIDRDLSSRQFIGTPIAEYRPSRIVRGSAVLIGDAAHVVSPASGLGFHSCLLDISALSAEVRGVARPELKRALERYERQRLGPAQRLAQESQEWSSEFVRSHRREHDSAGADR